MSDGPSRDEIERVREALERHDSRLRKEAEQPDDEPQEGSDEEDEDR